MKKVFNIIAIILLIVFFVYVLFDSSNRDDDEEIETWSYIPTEDGNAYLISAYNGESEIVTIEETYLDKPIIGFVNKIYLPDTTTKLILSKNLEDLNIESFYNYSIELVIPSDSKLKSFNCNMYATWIKNEVIFIPKDAIFCPNTFYENSGIKSFVVHQDNPYYKDLDGVVFNQDYSELIFYPSGKDDEEYNVPSFVESIGNNAFLGQRYLKTLNILDTVLEFGDYVFSYSHIHEVNIAETTTITDLGFKSFANMPSLKTFNVPDSIIELNQTFYESAVESIHFGEESELKLIRDDTFGMTRYLTSLTLPKQLETIDQSPFTNSFIEELVIQSDLVEIDSNTFSGFVGIQSITFTVPQSFISIENHVMTINDGKELIMYLPQENEAATLYIDQYIETINYFAFNRVRNLDRIEVDPLNNHFKSVNGVLFSSDLKSLLLYPYTSTYMSYEIPEGTIEVVNRFYGTYNLKELIIPSSLVTLPKYAFSNTSIESVIFSGESKIELIPEYAFSNTQIQSIIIPKSVSIIDRNAFSNTPIISLAFEEGTNISNINDYAFSKTSLVNLILPSTNVNIAEHAFSTYFLKNVYIPEKVITIDRDAFDTYPGITFYLERSSVPKDARIDGDRSTILVNQTLEDFLEAIS